MEGAVGKIGIFAIMDQRPCVFERGIAAKSVRPVAGIFCTRINLSDNSAD